MARFDVYSVAGGRGFLLDVQADLLQQLNTRVVVPLFPAERAGQPAERLNPQFEVRGQRLSMMTQFMAAVPATELKTCVATLDDHASAILLAIDFLHQGW